MDVALELFRWTVARQHGRQLGIHERHVRRLDLPEVRDRIVAMGTVPVGSTVGGFEAKHKEDLARFARIVAETRIPPQD